MYSRCPPEVELVSSSGTQEATALASALAVHEEAARKRGLAEAERSRASCAADSGEFLECTDDASAISAPGSTLL